MIDAIKIIRDHILTIAPVVALTGTRVFGGRTVPPKGHSPGDGDLLAFSIRSGQPDYDDALLTPSVQIKCYSTTAILADVLYRALYDGLQNSEAENILHAEIETIGQSLEEPGTEWFFILSYWRFMLRQ